MQQRKLEILLLCDIPPRIAETVRDHVEALEKLSFHCWHRFEMLGDIPSWLDLERFDVIVVHYTLVACNEGYLSRYSRGRLRNCQALKAIFVQDEYRHVNSTIAAMREIDVKVVFTCVPQNEIPNVYSEECLPGSAQGERTYWLRTEAFTYPQCDRAVEACFSSWVPKQTIALLAW